MKTIIKKTFLDLNKEEEWLNQQGNNGLMLIGYSNGEYEFEDVSPVEFQYKLDIPNYSGSKKKDYISFLEQSGISVVTEYAGKIYLRKNKADGPFELYTENAELIKQAKKRYSHFKSIGLSQFFLGVYFLIQMFSYISEKGSAFWINAAFGTACTIAGIIFLIIGVKGQKRYSLKKEDMDIWE